MRLWSLHPRYLDPKGLVALWREGLLAQAVLAGRTRGYTRHPQLLRFQECRDPSSMIADYLREVAAEADRRGYRFEVSRIGDGRADETLPVATAQLRLEWEHLASKLMARNPEWHAGLRKVRAPETHPLFHVVEGGIAEWERSKR